MIINKIQNFLKENYFSLIKFNNEDKEMSITEHLEELRERFFKSFLVFIGIIIINLLNVKQIVNFLQLPAKGVKFLQLAPGEYFFASLKIIIYLSILLSTPYFIYQIVMFIIPGLTRKERSLILPILIGSSTLFFLGICFGYWILVPAALNFFIKYGADLVEPLWSFEQYFNFILILLISTGLAFEVPILQILLGLFNIISGKKMLSLWRYIILLSTILSAILTPSTDPITQILLSLAILILYFFGIFFVFMLKK